MPDAVAQPADRRQAWLTDACPDTRLRAEVQALLEALDRAGDFLEGPPPALAAETGVFAETGRDRRFAPGDQLGRYQIVNLLGAGGMGEVYRAQDTRLRARLALSRVGGPGGAVTAHAVPDDH